MPTPEPTSAAGPLVLVVEDEPDMVRGLQAALSFEGFRVIAASDGASGLACATDNHPDCIILDLMLPDQNGYEVCRRLRAQGDRTPILMLTARSQESDKVRGLEVGADDYLTKPFSLAELVARVKALLRRASYVTEEVALRVGDAAVDLRRGVVTRGDVSEGLTPHEVELLRLLSEHRGQPVSRESILLRLWGPDSSNETRIVDNLVVKLRRKLEADQRTPQHVITVYGVGYKLE